MKYRNVVVARLWLSMIVVVNSGRLQAQKDPGPRSGAAGAGTAYPTLNVNEQLFFSRSSMTFAEVDSVSGKIEAGSGLGPTFNGNSCAQCHAQPAVGGSSPGMKSPQNPIPNPQVLLAALDGATNVVPSFITADGPVREARFVRNADGSPDGGVHGLFTIAGRTDAPGCSLAQPDFATQLARNNVIFRIPTPTFGLGLVEMTTDAALQANLARNQAIKSAFGIGGMLNTTGNDGTVTRFGWKAQNKSLLIFSGEAYNVEQGVTNESFPNERSAVPGCVFNPAPEDYTDMTGLTGTASDTSSDLTAFANFMMLSAPPTPALATPSTQNGASLFTFVGCALCHTPSLTTGPSRFTGMSNVVYHSYSDWAVHHMGAGLADGVTQGAAGPDQFRTAPLWGVGQRLYFLHDGRTSDLLQAIQAHASPPSCRGGGDNATANCKSEADAVIRRFNALSNTQQQDLLNFLRSL
jgi:CxxC motif-containing protein (DUF1111 family)